MDIIVYLNFWLLELLPLFELPGLAREKTGII